MIDQIMLKTEMMEKNIEFTFKRFSIQQDRVEHTMRKEFDEIRHHQENNIPY